MSKIYGNTVGGGGSQVSSEQIPTKISELENDEGFITLSDIPDGIDGLSMWAATIEHQGETCTTFRAQIPSTGGREIQVDDLILYTNGIVGRVIQAGVSSVVTEATGIVLKGEPGDKGPKGESGVYVGEEEPTGNEDIWLDPDDTEDLFVKSVNGVTPDINGNINIEIPTIEDIINGLPIWEGGEY